jgi:predicted metalloprotease with PDZ domain
MKPKALLTALLCALALISCGGNKEASYRMDYTVALDTAGHYLLVDLDLSGISGRVTLNMPRWTPGYYEMLDFPKHLCDFAASDAAGSAVAWEKSGMNRWIVTVPADGKAHVSYRIYANRRDVGSSRVDDRIAFISPAGVFMHVDGDLPHPVRVRFDPDDPACFAIDGDASGRLFYRIFTAVGAVCVAIGVIAAVVVLASHPLAMMRWRFFTRRLGRL